MKFKRKFFWLIFFFLGLLWFWTRIFNLTQTYYFSSDSGRDAWVLHQWQETGKIPILGPAPSFVIFHLSPLYFYILMPFYLITAGSYFYPHWAFNLITGTILFFVAWLVDYYRVERKIFLLLLLLLIFAPSVLSLSRYITNPSYTWPALLLSFWALFLSKKQTQPLWLILLSGASCAFAVTMNLSIIPVLAGYLLMAVLLYYPDIKRVLGWLLALSISLFVFHLPILLFEFKYNFQLSRRMLSFLLTTGLLEGNTAEKLIPPSLGARLSFLAHAVIGSRFLLILLFLYLGGMMIYLFKKNRKKLRQQPWFIILMGLLMTTVLTILPPIKINTFHIFGVLILFYLLLVFLPTKTKYGVIFLLCCAWLLKIEQIFFFQPEFTIGELEACMQQVYQHLGQAPTYYALISDQVDVHTRDSYAFGLSRAGCQVKMIATKASQAEQMVIFEEGTTYIHGENIFMEVELFGEASPSAQGQCRSDWGWTILRKERVGEENDNKMIEPSF